MNCIPYYAGLDKAIDAAIEAHMGVETDEEDEAMRRRIRRLELMQDLICAALGTTRYRI